MNPTTTQSTRGSAGTSMARMVGESASRYRGTALKYKEGGRWEELSYPDLGKRVRALAKGLLALGIERQERIAILSTTRPEWTIADFAGMAAGAIVVPVYQTNSPGECKYVLEHSESRLVFCENAEQLQKIEEIRGDLPKLEHVIAFEDGGSDGVLTLDDLVARGEQVTDEDLDERIQGVELEDVATIVYTSGTTGDPKGCVLTHGNLAADCEMVLERLPLKEDSVYFVFLPLAHVLTRVVQILAIQAGGTLAYWTRDPKKIVDEVAEVQPTYLPSVPRIFEKIHVKATAKADEAGGIKAKLFHWGVGVGSQVADLRESGKAPGLPLRVQYELADRLVLSKIRALFGGNIEYCLTGAAPIDPEILEFFHGAGVPVLEGYGMTETSAVATVNTPDEYRFGTVGKPLPRSEVKISDEGEVLMRGPHIFQGYYKNEEATKEDLKDGWLHSGDLGEIDEDGYVKITGRKKDLIITSSGKNITPSNIENQLKQSRWVASAVVYGDRKPYLVALLTLDPDEAPALAEKLGIDSDLEKMAGNEQVREEIQKTVDEANKNFARIEQVKRFALLGRDLTQEEGELTPTMKVKRNVVYEQHDDRFQELYS